MGSSEAKNLEAISKAIDDHNARCAFPAMAIRMNPFEVERLGWETIRGLPIWEDPNVGTGSFRVVCSKDEGGVEDQTEVSIEELVPVGVPLPVAPEPSEPLRPEPLIPPV